MMWVGDMLAAVVAGAWERSAGDMLAGALLSPAFVNVRTASART